MGGLTSTLETAKNSLLNTQVGIQTSSHNISNADNKSYSRQRVIMTSSQPYRSQVGWLGTGARIVRIAQQRDEFVQHRLMASVSGYSYFETLGSRLSSLSVQLSDDGTNGISEDLSAFFDSWETLNENPSGLSEKQGVMSAVNSLAENIRSTYERLRNYSDSASDDIANQVNNDGTTKSEVNSLLQKISEYNRQIRLTENPTQPANDLRDQRYQALRELSELIPVEYTEQNDGSLTVTLDYSDKINDPIYLVYGEGAGELSYDSANKTIEYHAFDYSSGPPPIGFAEPGPPFTEGGSLNGLLKALHTLDSPDPAVDDLMADLDSFAAALIDRVNTIHTNVGNDPQYGATWDYDIFTGTGASDIAIDSAFVIDTDTTANPQAVAAISDLARQLAALQDEDVVALGDANFSSYLGSIQQSIGAEQADAQSSADFQETLVEELDAQQQSVSGVSIDEELVEILKYQQVYQAAAKIIQQTSQLMDAVIQMV